jgi:hypothetical protein
MLMVPTRAFTGSYGPTGGLAERLESSLNESVLARIDELAVAEGLEVQHDELTGFDVEVIGTGLAVDPSRW